AAAERAEQPPLEPLQGALRHRGAERRRETPSDCDTKQRAAGSGRGHWILLVSFDEADPDPRRLPLENQIGDAAQALELLLDAKVERFDRLAQGLDRHLETSE